MAKTVKIGLDPGHGGADRANRGPTGYVEADGVLAIAKVVRDELKANGYEVFMTRETDKTLSLSQRAALLNKAGVDIAISIHTNAASDPKVRGIETIHSIDHDGAHDGDELAMYLAVGLKKDLGLKIRRTFDMESEKHPGSDYYGIIRQTNMTCVIVEVEFHTNPDAERLLQDQGFRVRAGESIAKSLMWFL